MRGRTARPRAGRRTAIVLVLGSLALLLACSPAAPAPGGEEGTPAPREAGRQGAPAGTDAARPEGPGGAVAVTSPTPSPSPSPTPTPGTPTPAAGTATPTAAAAAAAGSAQAAPTPTPTLTPTPAPVTALPSINAYLHDGPDTYATVVGNLLAGQRVTVLAISRDQLWLYVTGPSIGEDRGWVYINLVTVEGDVRSLPVR